MTRLNRRNFLAASSAIGLATSIPLKGRAQTAVGPVVDAVNHPKFVNDLPRPMRINCHRPRRLKMDIRAFEGWNGLVDDAGNPVTTVNYGYGPNRYRISSPGPTFETFENVPLRVKWKNKLPLGHILPYDLTIHCAEPENLPIYEGGVPTVTHLHGGHTEWESDGETEAWYTQNYADVGPTFVKKWSYYENTQEAAHLWYHDHALGLTRLNVLAGLAGNYILRDRNELRQISRGVLPSLRYEYELTIQDRLYDLETGAIAIENDTATMEANPDAFATSTGGQVGISVGDFTHVNGMVWPTLNVEPRKYRFRILNANLWRGFQLGLLDVTDFPEDEADVYMRDVILGGSASWVPYWLIGTDGGFLPEVVKFEADENNFEPAERLDVIIDFSAYEGRTIRMANTNGFGAPFGGPTYGANDRCMQFVVGEKPQRWGGRHWRTDARFNTDATTPEEKTDVRCAPLPSWVDKPVDKVFRVGMFTGTDQFGRLMMMQGNLNNTEYADRKGLDLGTRTWGDPVTETPRIGETVVFEIWNMSFALHPIHIHLVEYTVDGIYDPFYAQADNRPGAPFPGAPAIPGTPDFPVIDKDQALHHGHPGFGKSLNPDFPWGDIGGITGGDPKLCLPDVTLNTDMKMDTPLELQGLKDTVQIPAFGQPGCVVRVKMVFDKPGRYVWHCHLLSHEDHEMMRPLIVLDHGEEPEDYENFGNLPLVRMLASAE